ATIVDCCRVALDLRAVLAELGLRCVVKTSGGKGLHLSVPLHGSTATDETTKHFALALGRLLERRDPARVLVDMTKERRAGKVFVDWSQNDRHKTTVCAYSLRATPVPGVSTPIGWEEIEAVVDTDDGRALAFDPATVVARFDADGDLYAGSLAADQELPDLG
ncbi:MAG TPA: ATP-dependent DNA ligase, partial [Acidimicrobiia bacterium]|nr:ATP-dependent DNA ligase [Acidimicrobiia bacterium]